MSARKLEAAKRVSQKLLKMSSDEFRSALDAQEGSFYKKVFDRFFDLSREIRQEATFELISVSKVIPSRKVTVTYSSSITFEEVVNSENEENKNNYYGMAA
ncbi:hypothetical protein [Marinomonas sp.]|uniref:hypothetical protein n=1 Tax=Marinomonas sp. TaxID=1904862 RepID=UPI003A935D44